MNEFMDLPRIHKPVNSIYTFVGISQFYNTKVLNTVKLPRVIILGDGPRGS